MSLTGRSCCEKFMINIITSINNSYTFYQCSFNYNFKKKKYTIWENQICKTKLLQHQLKFSKIKCFHFIITETEIYLFFHIPNNFTSSFKFQ